MKILRHPHLHALLTAAMSFFYAAVFLLTSGHLEFEQTLQHGNTLQHTFWNSWSAFLKAGNLKYIGYVYLLMAVCVVVLSMLRKNDYDEYQTRILADSLIANGFLMLLLFPAALLLTLSDPNYAIETIVFLISIHWFVFLLANLIYTIKWCME